MLRGIEPEFFLPRLRRRRVRLSAKSRARNSIFAGISRTHARTHVYTLAQTHGQTRRFILARLVKAASAADAYRARVLRLYELLALRRDDEETTRAR